MQIKKEKSHDCVVRCSTPELYPKKNHMIIPNNAEKAVNEIQYSFMIFTNSQKIKNREKLPLLDKECLQTP